MDCLVSYLIGEVKDRLATPKSGRSRPARTILVCFGILSAVCAWVLSVGVVMVNINFRSVYVRSKNLRPLLLWIDRVAKKHYTNM